MYRNRLARIGAGLAAASAPAWPPRPSAAASNPSRPRPQPRPTRDHRAGAAAALKRFEQLAADHEADHHGQAPRSPTPSAEAAKAAHALLRLARQGRRGAADAATIFRCGSIGKTSPRWPPAAGRGGLAVNGRQGREVRLRWGCGYADHPPITVRQVLTVRQPSPRPSSAPSRRPLKRRRRFRQHDGPAAGAGRRVLRPFSLWEAATRCAAAHGLPRTGRAVPVLQHRLGAPPAWPSAAPPPRRSARRRSCPGAPTRSCIAAPQPLGPDRRCCCRAMLVGSGRPRPPGRQQ